MNRTLVLVLLWLVPGLALGSERAGVVTLTIDVKAPSDASSTRAWIPYPVSGAYQTVSDVDVTGNFTESAVYQEPESESIYVYADWRGSHDKRTLRMSFTANAKEVRSGSLTDSGQTIPASVRRYLEPNWWIPTGGEVYELAQEITKGRDGILARSRAVYDWVVANTYRDPDVKGCGLGIVEQTLARRGGKCADISSVFVALARAAGVPARDVFGLRLGKDADQDITKGFHCWAEFYLPGTGWVPVDPADVRKIMLKKNLDLAEAEEYVEYYFGNLDTYRLALEKSERGITFIPPQEDGKLNYFMYPYVEVDGRALDYFDPSAVSYRVHFKAL